MRIVSVAHPHPYEELALPSLAPIPDGALVESTPRGIVSELLVDYNNAIGNDDPAVRANCKRLGDEGVNCVVTSQQLGYLGGPAYTILKAITCILVARQLDAVPIFWLATEDHDVGEIAATTFIDEGGNLLKRKLPLPKNGCAVEDIVLSDAHAAIIETHLAELALEGVLGDAIAGCRYADVMVRAIATLFPGEGLLFLEPRLLRRLAIPFFRDELVEANAIRALLRKSRELSTFEGAGTNLFFKDDAGRRRKVDVDGTEFVIGDARYSLDAMLDLVERAADRFSPNVVARPLLQNLLLPAAAYVAGPSEVAYLRQLSAYHRFHGAHEAAIVPRLSATGISVHEQALFACAGREPTLLLPDNWGEWFINADEQRAALHRMRNSIAPYGGFQECTLNWWHFQRGGAPSIVQEMLNQCDWRLLCHHFCLFEEET